MLDAFATILSHVPVVERAMGKRPSDSLLNWTIIGNAFATIGFFSAIPTYLSAAPDRCVTHTMDVANLVCHPGCCEPAQWGLALGIPLGIAVAVAVRAVLVARLRGRSNSSSRVNYPAVIAGFLVAELALIASCAIAWWDFAP